MILAELSWGWNRTVIGNGELFARVNQNLRLREKKFAIEKEEREKKEERERGERERESVCVEGRGINARVPQRECWFKWKLVG